MKGKRPITGGLYKTKNARKLTDTILKPKFTGSQASKKSNEQRSKFSRLTNKAKSHCEISSQLSQIIKIPSIETKIQDPMQPGIPVSTEQLYEKDSYEGEEVESHVPTQASAEKNLDVSFCDNRFSGTSESDMCSSGYSETPTQSTTTPRHLSLSFMSQTTDTPLLKNVLPSSGINSSTYDIETTMTRVIRDDQEDGEMEDEIVLFSKRRRRSRPSSSSSSSSHKLNYAVETVEKSAKASALPVEQKQAELLVESQVQPLLLTPLCSRCDFKELNIPEAVINQWKERGISKLHPWQLECLKVDHGYVLDGGSLVYSAPTGGGKTLVAEVLMVRRLLCSNHEGIVLWVVPLKALANEIVTKLSPLLGQGKVEAFHSDNSKNKISSSVSVAVCTYERANMILNQQFEEQCQYKRNLVDDYGSNGGISGISMIVVDEVHNIERNAVLERLLTKINFMNSFNHNNEDGFGDNTNIQIVACSATIPNVASIAKWCNASSYSTSTRTTILDWFVVLKDDTKVMNKHKTNSKQKVVCNNNNMSAMFNITSVSNPCSSDMTIAKTPKFTLSPTSASDIHGLITLCADAIKNSCSVLVFCNSRFSTSKLATFVASVLRKQSTSRSDSIQNGRDALVTELCQISGKQAAEGLTSLLQLGIGYHHAALSQEEKSLVEKGFRSKVLDLLFATTTLANGVNLPADRVIIYDPVKFSRGGQSELYSIQELKQMGGRAAREGVGSRDRGDVIILTTTGANGGMITDKQKVQGKKGFTIQDILGQPQPPILSPLLNRTQDGHMAIDGDVMECCVLEAVCLGIATDKSSLVAYTHSLFASFCLEGVEVFDKDSGVISLLVDALESALFSLQGGELRETPLLTLVMDTYVPEALGRATIGSFLTPKEARTLLHDIVRASRGVVVTSQLHLLCLVAPIESSVMTPWSVLFDELVVVGNHEDWCRVADVYICPTWRGRIQEHVKGSTTSKHNSLKLDPHQKVDAKLGRFFRALLLRHIIEEEPLDGGLAGLVKLEVGKAQALQRNAFDLCGKVLSFCKTLGFNSVATMLKPLRNRLQFGIKKELLSIRCLSSNATPSLIRCFYDAGFTTPKSFLKKGSKDILLDILVKRRQVHYIKDQRNEGGCNRGKRSLSSIDLELVEKIMKTAHSEVLKSKGLKNKIKI